MAMREPPYEDELARAAAEVSAAERAFRAGVSPDDPNWTTQDEAAYIARFEKWRTASRKVVAALDELARGQDERCGLP